MKLGIKIGAVMLSAACAATAFTGCGGSGGGSSDISAVYPKNGEIVNIANNGVAEFCSDYVSGSDKILSYANNGDNYYMAPLILKWSAKTPAERYEVKVSRNADMSRPQSYSVTSESLRLSDLFVNTDYYWQVSSGDIHSEVFSFTTANTPRTIALGGVSNTRDIGGKSIGNGKFVKQGVVFRGGKLDDITDDGKKDFTEKYGIKTDLDLRLSTEGPTGSSPAGAQINYLNYSCPYYRGDSTGIDNPENYANLAAAMRVFVEPSNYPVYFHCAIGRDRTAMVAMLLLGVCGVSTEDICLDYEMSFFSKSGCMDGANPSAMASKFFATVNCIKQYGETYGDVYGESGELSFKRCCEIYLMQIGLTKNEIDEIRTNLVE